MIDEEAQEDSLDNSISYRRHKIVVVGGPGGKTSIIKRIINGSWDDNVEISIGIDFWSKIIKFREQNIKIQIWDACSLEIYNGLIPSYIRDSPMEIKLI